MHYLDLPQWGSYLLEGILLFIGLSSTAVVLTRTGRSPYWAFLMLIPFVQIAAIWYLAFSVWSGPLKKTG
jgi:hypothetical protein